MTIEIVPVLGIPEVAEGVDLGGLIAAHADLHDRDVVVVAQKAVSKAEGRLIEVDPERRTEAKRSAIASESVRVVARRGDLTIVETRHGFVCANAGVDASNVAADRLALLPLDPDASAARIRRQIRRAAGVEVGVIVSDTFGRPWRTGQTNVAIGVAGLDPVRDHRGEKDAHGNLLEATVIAVADEIAGAAELVMRKSDRVAAAIARGFEGTGGEGCARALVRPAAEDLFRAGSVETVEARRSVRAFAPGEVPEEVIRRAVEAAATAPVPHGSRVPHPWRFVWLRSPGARRAFLEAIEAAWRRDLDADGASPSAAGDRIARSREILGKAPVLLACFVSTAGADPYPDERRRRAERDMFVAASGAAVENLMIALAAQAVGSCWLSSTMFCPEEATSALGLGPEWVATGCVAAGYSASGASPREPGSSERVLDAR